MNSFFDNLYNKLLLRDVLGKAFPGFILLLGSLILVWHGGSRGLLLGRHANIVHFFLLYGACFTIGMMLQFINPFRRNWQTKGDYDFAQLTRYHTFLGKQRTANKGAVADAIISQRERLVVLKDMTGNLAMALTVLFAIALCKHYFIVAIAMSLMAFVLFRQSLFHTQEQIHWEGLPKK